MIKTISIDVSGEKSFDFLQDDETIDDQIIRSFFTDEVICRMNGQAGLMERTDLVVMEYPYYDREYLSCVYKHGMKYTNIDKRCLRVIFFSKREPNLIEEYSFPNDYKFLGFCTLFPVNSPYKLGRVSIDPSSLLNDNYSVISYQSKIHHLGYELTLDAFPCIKQLPYGLCCGHDSLWGILNYFPKFHDYAATRFAEVLDDPENALSATDGISGKQMSAVLTRAGCLPVLRWMASGCYSYFDLIEELSAYVQSKIPVILLTNKGKLNHAVLCVGYKMEKAISLMRECTPWCVPCQELFVDGKPVLCAFTSALLNTLIVLDDSEFAYSELPISALNSADKNNSYGKICGFVAPLYSKMKLNYVSAKQFALCYLREENANIGFFNQGCGMIDISIVIVSSNTYKEFVRKNLDTYPYADFVLAMELPKLVWLIQISDESLEKEGMSSGVMLLDTTAFKAERDVYFALLGQENAIFKDNGAPVCPDKVAAKPVIYPKFQ